MKNLKALREKSRLTQTELAQRVGTTQQTIARWEAGKAEPNLAALRDLAICLGTTVDGLVGRTSVIAHQTTDPFAWISGDESGYWGNIGLRLPQASFSRWYPITTTTMRRLSSDLQSVAADNWISFQTLNNKMVCCRPASVKAFTFLDEAEDQIEGDWQVGPADVEGWPMEVYGCLEHLMYERHSVRANDQFSDKLIHLANTLIGDHDLDDEKLEEMCVDTRVIYTDGTSSLFCCSPDRLADIVAQVDLGFDLDDSAMLHLDDKHGDHSVFISTGLVSLMELPLIILKRGLEALDSELSNDEVDNID
ncbi:helix-turn-helix transcriptional regulator [Paracoccus sp. S3-43]|uniref:helix-turn-helix domain-containing protein n=1 Tax=Paracoccus sp. S3-43 TaxID=3030011 RepID=UPI0023AF365C|nr:helix-turn-helix transcriptional regulator [Paracoccus sp. S3-43]WEF23654.1 helix-turn-helix transcriptional regulator [Paracoccus sp. S3-43]